MTAPGGTGGEGSGPAPGPGDGWRDPAGESPVLLVRSRDRARILEYSLLLASQNLRHYLAFQDGRYSIAVESADWEPARALLLVYIRENRGFGPGPGGEADGRALAFSLEPLAFLAVPVATYFAVGFSDLAPWLEKRGAADRDAILAGEWWRCWTALTLHAGHAHFLGNMLSGYFLLNLLGHRMGPGSALWVATALAGLANFLVALASAPGRVSLGFSTVVFACLGSLAALESRALARRKAFAWRDLSPLVSALFVAVLTGLGPGADIKAHFLGLGLGAAWGWFLGPAGSKLETPAWQWGLGAFGYLWYALCWALAIGWRAG